MDFSKAERFINMSLLYNKVPLLVVGNNGIGKTTLLEAISRSFKSTLFTTAIDYGGIKSNIQNWRSKNYKTIVLSDLQSTLTRKRAIVESTIGAISMLMSDGINNEMTYKSDNFDTKGYKVNFVVGLTYAHLYKLVSYGYYDFLDRCAIIQLERDKIDVNVPFSLQHPLIKHYDKVAYKSFKFDNVDYDIYNARHNEMIRNIKQGFTGMGVTEEMRGVEFAIFATELLNRNAAMDKALANIVKLKM